MSPMIRLRSSLRNSIGSRKTGLRRRRLIPPILLHGPWESAPQATRGLDGLRSVTSTARASEAATGPLSVIARPGEEVAGSLCADALLSN